MFNKKKILKYLLSFIIELLIFFIIIIMRGIFNAETYDKRLLIVCDGFFIVGVLLASIGALVVISNGGFFDILGYGVKSLLILFTPKKLGKVEYYYEYRERKKAEREGRTSLWYILIEGAIFIAFSALCFLFD